MEAKRLYKLVLCLFLIICPLLSIELSYIDVTNEGSTLVKSYTAKASDFIWLQEVNQQYEGQSLRVFIRSRYDDYQDSSFTSQQRLEDPNGQLQLKAVDEQNLKCALFYNKTSEKYFIHVYPDSYPWIWYSEDEGYIELDDSMVQFSENEPQHERTFKINSFCDSVLIDNTKLYVAVYKYQITTDQEWNELEQLFEVSWDLTFDSALIDTTIVGYDDTFIHIVTADGDIYQMHQQQISDFDQINNGQGGWNYVSLAYRDFYFQYLISVDIPDLNVQLHSSYVSNSQSNYQDDNFSHYKILIVGVKIVPQGFNYTVISIVNDFDYFYETTIVSEISGQSKTKPVYTFGSDLQRIIITGTQSSGTQLYEGYIYSYTERNFKSMVFPSSISNGKWNLLMKRQFLYAKSAAPTHGKFKESAYIFAEEKMYPYFEEKIIEETQYNENWVNSFLRPDKYYTKSSFWFAGINAFHVYQSENRLYYRKQQIGPFQSSLNTKDLPFIEYNFTLEKNFFTIQTSIIPAKIGYSWLYMSQDAYDKIMTATLISYNKDTKVVKNTSLVLQEGTYMQLLPFMVSPKIDCFYQMNDITSNYDFYLYDGSKLAFLSSISMFDFEESYLESEKDLKIASKCSIVQIRDKMYFYNRQLAKFEEKSILPLNPNTTEFDSDFMFGIEGSDFYKLNGVKYEKVFSYPFKKNNEIFPSEDGQKVIILTYENFTQKAKRPGTNKTFLNPYTLFELVTLTKTSGNWIEVKAEQKLTTDVKIADAKPSVNISKNFERTLACYTLKTTTSQKFCLLSLANFSLKKSYQSVYQFQSKRSPWTVNVKNNLIHIIDSQEVKTFDYPLQIKCKENIFEVKNNTIGLLLSSDVECSLYVQTSSEILYSLDIVEDSVKKEYYSLFHYIGRDQISLIKSTSKSYVNPIQQINILPITRGFFYKNNNIYQCPNGCLTCENSQKCTKCLPGYTIAVASNSFVCAKCKGVCEFCDYEYPAYCIRCPPGFFHNDTSLDCETCHQNCQTCSGGSSVKCTSCRIGYFLNKNIEPNKNKTCISCPQNCDYCSNSTFCTSCQFGFTASANGLCVKCPLDCSVCDPVEITKCLGCTKGFELVTVDGKQQCQKCPDLCAQCSNGKCTKCRDSAYFNTAKNSCKNKCQSPCKTCSVSDSHSCTACIMGYKLNGAKCEPDISCSVTSSCISCPSGYFMMNGKCYECSVGQNCAECQMFDPTRCASCREGFFLSQSGCEKCESSCRKCFDKTRCQQCQVGYFLSQMNSTASVCMKCATNCKTCIESSTNCLSCEEGYQLSGLSCVSTQTVGFSLKLNTDIEKFTVDLYNQLIQELAKMVNKSASEVRITSLKNGSVLIQGTIDTTSSEDGAAALKSLNTSLSSGAKIAGQQVLESRFVSTTAPAKQSTTDSTTTPTPTPTPSPTVTPSQTQNQTTTQTVYIQKEKTNNTAVIAAIVVPIILIVGFVVGVVAYKKWKKNSAKASQMSESPMKNASENQISDKPITVIESEIMTN